MYMKLYIQDGAIIGVKCARMVIVCGNDNMLVEWYQPRIATQYGILILQHQAW